MKTGAPEPRSLAKYLPAIVAALVQQGVLIFIMEFVRRDLFLAGAVGVIFGILAHQMTARIQHRG